MWKGVTDGWVVGADALPLLQLACECWDRYRRAAELLDAEGPVVVNENSGAVRTHPAHAVMRDNLTQIRQCFRQLHLDPPEEL